MCEKLFCKTTRSHYEKYAKMKKDLGITYQERNPFMSKKFLVAAFKEDKHLNDISLAEFDAFYTLFLVPALRAGYRSFSKAENTCLLKHCLIYDAIGAEPLFEDE